MISSSDDLTSRLKTFEREAFRLEILDHYEIPSSAENLRAFLAGEPKPEAYNAGWLDAVRKATGSGKRMYRVHILSRPLTPYLRYELGWGYLTNMEAGEEFFILDTTEQENPLADAPDFWLFDEEAPAVMNYDDAGTFLGPTFVPTDRAAEFVGLRDTALAHAVPFTEWWAKHGAE